MLRLPTVSGARKMPWHSVTGDASSAVAVAPAGAESRVTMTGSVRPVFATRTATEPGCGSIMSKGMLRGSIVATRGRSVIEKAHDGASRCFTGRAAMQDERTGGHER